MDLNHESSQEEKKNTLNHTVRSEVSMRCGKLLHILKYANK